MRERAWRWRPPPDRLGWSSLTALLLLRLKELPSLLLRLTLLRGRKVGRGEGAEQKVGEILPWVDRHMFDAEYVNLFDSLTETSLAHVTTSHLKFALCVLKARADFARMRGRAEGAEQKVA